MQRLLSLLLITLSPGFAWSDMVTPTRTIRANAIIADVDVTLNKTKTAEGFARLEDVIGQEARIVLYPGRPIRAGDIGPPALVTRNQVVRLQFAGDGLQIITEGRALERGALGDRVRIMNLTSRTTLFGQVMADGSIRVTR